MAIFFVSWYLLTRLFVFRIVNCKFRKITDLLLKNCDAASFLTEFRKFAYVNLRSNEKNYIYCNISTGLIYVGDFNGAFEMLRWIDISGTKTPPIYAATYHNNMLTMQLHLNDFENAEKSLFSLRNLRSRFGGNAKVLEMYREMAESAALHFNLIVNKDTSALQYYEKRFEEKPDLYDKVMAKYYLSLIYQQLSDESSAQSCLQYVAANGKDFFGAKPYTAPSELSGERES